MHELKLKLFSLSVILLIHFVFIRLIIWFIESQIIGGKVHHNILKPKKLKLD